MSDALRNEHEIKVTDDSQTALESLACPQCHRSLSAIDTKGDHLDCLHCGSSFPRLDNAGNTLLWLFPEPECAKLDWQARLNGFNAQTTTLLESLGLALRQSDISCAVRQRLQALYDARKRQWHDFNALLAEINLAEPVHDQKQPSASARLMHRVPGNQAIDSYEMNLFRDWSWNNGEYLEMRSIVLGLLKAAGGPGPGCVLTLGAGGCRLSLDIHRHVKAESSVVLDINPLLLSLAQRVVNGQPQNLSEFPLVARDGRVAIERSLTATEPLDDEDGSFQFVVGDSSYLPIADRSVGTLVTPWLIDIQPQEFRLFARRMNKALANGGVWINTGTLAFLNQPPEFRYSADELLDVLAECGFEVLTSEHRTVNYLCSPDGAHGRVESIFSFAVRKVSECASVASAAYVPEWLSNTNTPIPESMSLPIDAARHLLNAQVLGAIDGRTSIAELGEMLANVHGLPVADAINAIRRLMLERFESTGDDGVL